MKRLLWLGIGVAVGVLVVRKVSQVAQRYSPGGIAESARESATGVLDTVRDFVADVRDGMAEREAQLHAAFDQGVTFEDLDDYDDEYDYRDEEHNRR
ncbi:hypothetical protein GCM10009682_31820 [Luedemannella flava]|uniref:Uncharacterized protein n=1 Tax=Luedemannella flava TaxID=349316 RepID=A0ABP4Y936_9ACTN